MKLIKSPEGIALSFSHYIKKVIEKFGYSDQKSISTSYDPSIHLKKYLGEPIDQFRYSQIIGSFLYMTNGTRPDIAYIVGRLSRHIQNPNQSHWSTVERLFDILREALICLSCTWIS